MKWVDVLVVLGLVLVPALLILAGVWWQLWLTGKVRAWAVRRFNAVDPESRDKLMPSIKRIPGRVGSSNAPGVRDKAKGKGDPASNDRGDRQASRWHRPFATPCPGTVAFRCKTIRRHASLCATQSPTWSYRELEVDHWLAAFHSLGRSISATLRWGYAGVVSMSRSRKSMWALGRLPLTHARGPDLIAASSSAARGC